MKMSANNRAIAAEGPKKWWQEKVRHNSAAMHTRTCLQILHQSYNASTMSYPIPHIVAPHRSLPYHCSSTSCESLSLLVRGSLFSVSFQLLSFFASNGFKFMPRENACCAVVEVSVRPCLKLATYSCLPLLIWGIRFLHCNILKKDSKSRRTIPTIWLTIKSTFISFAGSIVMWGPLSSIKHVLSQLVWPETSPWKG